MGERALEQGEIGGPMADLFVEPVGKIAPSAGPPDPAPSARRVNQVQGLSHSAEPSVDQKVISTSAEQISTGSRPTPSALDREAAVGLSSRLSPITKRWPSGTVIGP